MGTKKVPFLLLFLTRLDNNTQHTLFFETTKMLSMRSSSSCVHHHVRPFAGAAQCNKRHSISMTTRRRHAVVSVSSFSVSDITGPVNDTVNDLKSIEVRIHSPIIFFVFILSVERITRCFNS